MKGKCLSDDQIYKLRNTIKIDVLIIFFLGWSLLDHETIFLKHF